MSQSASVTLCPCCCSQAARWTAMVDFPTPPLELAMTIIMFWTIEHCFHAGKQYVHQAGEAACKQAVWTVCLQAILKACHHADKPCSLQT